MRTTTRRDTMMIGSALALLLSGNTQPPDTDLGAAFRIRRIFTAPDGASVAEEHLLKSDFTLPALSLTVSMFHKGNVEQRHVTPAKFVVITVSGTYSIELTGGTQLTFGPGEVALFEDLTGSGHISRSLTDGSVLLCRMADDFDLLQQAQSSKK